ncbi:MAG: signal peptide peptidase SppA [Niabella sp.]
MKLFFKIFIASLLALIVFSVITFFMFVGVTGVMLSGSVPKVGDKAVLTIDLETKYPELPVPDMQKALKSAMTGQTPGLFDVVRLIENAGTDNHVKGILLRTNGNANGFAASQEIRSALQAFKKSGKFVFAHGDVVTQKAYSIANVSDKIFVSPTGYFEWTGYNVSYTFLKGLLDKLQINPQIFYAGKFKSATEPLRADKMTDANRLQTSEWLNGLYGNLLATTAEARKLDTAKLRLLANTGVIKQPKDAVENGLIDAVKYDDELKDEIKKKLSVAADEKINFVSIEDYAAANGGFNTKGENIALIYASGDIVDGEAEPGNIGSANYISLLRNARLDKSIKAIVVRVNSGGGSALASENILREMQLAKKAKPLIVSFGDVAASGGYYMSCAADSIFAWPNTITGSIGVFGIVPDMSSFFKNKLGVTFDGVKTGPLANVGSMDHAMTAAEKDIFQKQIETIYGQFKSRVAEGRKKDTAYIETIAQGRVWTGDKAKEIGLVDATGGLNDALKAAAAKAGLKAYNVKEYPKPQTFWEKLLGMKTSDVQASIKADVGEEYYNVYKQLTVIRQMCNMPQARLPFDFNIR